ncbi:MAG: hypothetical protein GY909_08905 [Oligoflexia bacterium]|nr:hypothetical protein [Oligoflexia bacterium]
MKKLLIGLTLLSSMSSFATPLGKYRNDSNSSLCKFGHESSCPANIRKLAYKEGLELGRKQGQRKTLETILKFTKKLSQLDNEAKVKYIDFFEDKVEESTVSQEELYYKTLLEILKN